MEWSRVSNELEQVSSERDQALTEIESLRSKHESEVVQAQIEAISNHLAMTPYQLQSYVDAFRAGMESFKDHIRSKFGDFDFSIIEDDSNSVTS